MQDKCILRVLSQDSDLNYNVEIAVLRSGRNRNNWDFQNVEQCANTFRGVPILCAYLTNGQIADGHNMSQKKLPGGEIVYDFTGPNHERIVGAIGSNEEDVRTEVIDDQVWVIAIGKLWRFYNWQLVDKIAEQGRMEVSAETEVIEEYEDDGVSVFTNWRALGVTILNEKVAPAVPGANIKALKELGERFEEVRLAAASYHPEQAKPHNSTQKGMKHHMRLSKQQLRELPAFEGYTALAAEQNDDGVIVCLMSKAGKTAIYKMASVSEAVVPERIEEVNAQVHFCAEGFEDVLVDACDMVESVSVECASLEARLASAETSLTQATDKIEQMVNAENARRLSAAKDKAVATLAAFNANRAAKIEEKVLEALTQDIEAGKFTACADENGAWTGEQIVAEKVLSLCAAAVMEQDKLNAQHTEPMQWGSVRQASAAPGTVGELFASKM